MMVRGRAMRPRTIARLNPRTIEMRESPKSPRTLVHADSWAPTLGLLPCTHTDTDDTRRAL